jgi:hypothetical protein
MHGHIAIYPDIFFIFPTVTVSKSECPCCRDEQWVVALEWLNFGIGVYF